ncbi:MAG: SUMF1/EgtB/PvdO family nonheme iron enzyme [Phycisphaerales bacterium]|nr:MAG: SUMF1/EgtB/PvdO family nonheme iron enzyme [Phycisphaerales bacterium]
MGGNVWGWMENWYDKDEDVRCLRGGSWGDVDVNLRRSYRNLSVPDGRAVYVGFRVVFSQSSDPFDTLRL